VPKLLPKEVDPELIEAAARKAQQFILTMTIIQILPQLFMKGSMP
jgi:hypothetical protein